MHQNSCIFDGELAFVDEYGGVDDADGGKWLAREMGDASGILLAHHGAIVTGPTVAEMRYKATTFERMCRFTYGRADRRRADRTSACRMRPGSRTCSAQSPRRLLGRTVRLLVRNKPEIPDVTR